MSRPAIKIVTTRNKLKKCSVFCLTMVFQFWKPRINHLSRKLFNWSHMMFKLFYTEMKVFARDWWFWLIQVIQTPMVVASIIFLLDNKMHSNEVVEILNFALLWI